MVSLAKARFYLYAHGTLWEQALFDYLFGDGPLERLHQCLLCYKNPDGGWGHGMEHDLKCPDSNPMALEFLLHVIRDTGIPIGNILDGTVVWLEQNRNRDGSFRVPSQVFEYPLAPWLKKEIDQSIPDSTTGNLMRLGLCSASLAETTQRWVEAHWSPTKVLENQWLFMAYHAFDYFCNAPETPFNRECKQATLQNIIQCVKTANEKQYFTLFHYITDPAAELVQALPGGMVERFLDYLEGAQREDGGWDDEHGLKYWQPYNTILILKALRNFGRV